MSRTSKAVEQSRGCVGVRETKCRFFGNPIWTGTESALVEAGIVKAEWLPGKTGNNRTQQVVRLGANGAAEMKRGRGDRRSFCAGEGGTLLTITKTGAARFRVEREATEEERATAQARWHIERLAREAEMAERRLEAREVEDWNPAEFRVFAEVSARVNQQITLSLVNGVDVRSEKKPAHKLAELDRQRIEQKFHEIAAIIQNATVVPVEYPSAQPTRPRPTLSLVKGGQ